MITPPETIATTKTQDMIFLIRGCRVMIDADLARIYGVTTKRLKEQVRRNKQRFPIDFMLQLTREELKGVAANCGHLKSALFSRYFSYAFTEHGALMLASVLNSQTAVQASIAVVRAFVRLRETLAAHAELAAKIATLEKQSAEHGARITNLFESIAELRELPKEAPRKIGFKPD